MKLLPHQIPPKGAWGTWVILGGRGAGKTYGAAAYCRERVGAGDSVLALGPSRNHVGNIMAPATNGLVLCAAPPNLDPIRGKLFPVVWLDEPSLCPEEYLDEYLDAALNAGRNGKIIVSQYDGADMPSRLTKFLNGAAITRPAPWSGHNLTAEYVARLKEAERVRAL